MSYADLSGCQSSSTPETTTAGLNGGELAEAKRYGRRELFCTLADKAIDVVYLLLFVLFLARPLESYLQNFSLLKEYVTLRLTALFLVLLLLHLAVSFPLSYYSGHLLEHQFKLSTLSFGRWLWRYVKRNLVGGGLMWLMVLALFWLIWTLGAAWWPVAAVAFFLFAVVLGRLAPVVILPLFYRFEKLNMPELTARLEQVMAGTGISLDGVYRIELSTETVKANAMLAGMGRTRRVLLGDTLLRTCTTEELEVIFAHEVGHHVFRHISKIMLLGLVCGFIGFWLCDRVLAVWAMWCGEVLDYAHLSPEALPLLMFVITLLTMIIEPLQNALSRRFEREADRYALQRTGLFAAYRSAFYKLARLNKDDPNPHWLDLLLFHSHPSVAQRLAFAEQAEAETRNRPLV